MSLISLILLGPTCSSKRYDNPRIYLFCSIPKRRPQVSGVRLDSIFEDLPAEAQDSLVTQLAHFMLEASRHSFPEIGSIVLPQNPAPAPSPLPTNAAAVPPLGPLTHPCFYVDGRNALTLDRGPFPTARAYFLACAERERAATRALFASGAGAAGAEYQALLADTHALVERAVALLIELVRRCEGLDGADAELARYALDLHELGPKNIIVAPDEPTRIVRPFFTAGCWSHIYSTLSRLFIFSLRLSIGSLPPYDRSGVAHVRHIGSCHRLSATTMRASSDCEACFARPLRTTRSLHVRWTRMIHATHLTKSQSTTRSVTAFWCYRRCRACMHFSFTCSLSFSVLALADLDWDDVD